MDLDGSSLDDIYFEPNLQFLVCKVHGFGIPPTLPGITRHLRGPGHLYRGRKLKETISFLGRLPLRSVEELKQFHSSPTLSPPVPPISFLKVLRGFSCGVCNGAFLSTSAELLQRHLATVHLVERRTASNWELCDLQTLFNETKHRKYFRVHPSTNDFKQNFPQNKAQAIIKQFQERRTTTKDSAEQNNRSDGFQNGLRLRPSPRVCHPFTHVAKKHIGWISEARIDSLFKNEPFWTSSEPLFNPGHVDAVNGMQAIVPGCHHDPLFYSTLLYSMIQFSGHANADAQRCRLERQTLQLLYQRLSEMSASDNTVIIACLMILKATAYKLDDARTHGVHASGLRAVLKNSGSTSITNELKRALFWQDLYGALLLDEVPQINDIYTFNPVPWLRLKAPELAESLLPIGFIRIPRLPLFIRDCVIDILEFQTLSATLNNETFLRRYQQFDSMQACIESRLIYQDGLLGDTRPLVDAVRLSVLLCCYCSWMEVWNSKLILSKITEKLLILLERDVTLGISCLAPSFDLDLVLWMLLVACNTTQFDCGYTKDPKTRLENVITGIETLCNRSSSEEVMCGLQHALQSFIYCSGWLDKRSSIPVWHSLEASIRGSTYS